MDRASASEAGNVGSTPAERKFKNPAWCGVFDLCSSRQTALPACGSRKPEPYASLSSRKAGTKGEHGEAGPRAPRVSKATCGRRPNLSANLKTPPGAGFLIYARAGKLLHKYNTLNPTPTLQSLLCQFPPAWVLPLR